MSVAYTVCCRASIVTGADLVRHCADCGAADPHMVQIQTRTYAGFTRTRCGAACLAGRVSCDCRCNGRCHGAGRCRCHDTHATLVVSTQGALL
jgi:hypothetical protein